MTPTLSGRVQTRLLLLVLVGAPWTAIITPALPRPGWVPLSMLYDIMFRGLLLVAVVGIVWELIYHAAQQLRWDKDWPSLLQLLVMLNEGIVVWLILHASHTIPGTVGISAPLVPAYTIYFASTWTLVWLVMHGPLRVAALRWRFEGARLLPRRAPARVEHSPEPAPEVSATADIDQRDTRRTSAAPHVDGLQCARGHFNHPHSPYCVSCGLSLRQDGSAHVTAPRPPLGALILDTGRAVPLDGDYVIGAKPSRDPRVRAGHASPLVLRDRSGSLAAAHLDITLDGWEIKLCDRGSVLGTQIAHDDAPEWVALLPHKPVPLDSGTRIRVATHTIVVESQWPLSRPHPSLSDRGAPRARHAAGRHRAEPGSRGKKESLPKHDDCTPG